MKNLFAGSDTKSKYTAVIASLFFLICAVQSTETK